jgi:hypothetical protein
MKMPTIVFFAALAPACAFVATLLLPLESPAIPAFARKYDMSCNVCHLAVPVLKPYGNEFAANGYQIPDKEPPRFTRQTGDDMLYLMRELPLAIRIDGFAQYLPDAGVEGDVEWPYIIKILSSGQVRKDISYFFYFLFDEEGEVAGVEDAFLYFNDVGGGPFDILVGQYQVADPIFKRELRPTFEDYHIYGARPGMSRADLTYDRGIVLNYTLPTGTDFFLSVVNGNGIGPASGGVFDNDPNKNLFLRLAQPLDSSVSIGTLGYLGREDETGRRNNLGMVGGDLTLGLGNFQLGGQLLYRHDSNPFFAAGVDSVVNTRGGFAQLTFAPEMERSRWYLFALYNRITSDAEELNYHSVAGNITYLLARNFKLMAEYGYDIEHEANRFTLGFMTAF